MSSMTVWEFLEQRDARIEATQAVYEWSLNYHPGEGPFSCLLDLVGWSAENLGESCYRGGRLGWREAGLLADALREWADDPHRIEDWIDRVIALEMNG